LFYAYNTHKFLYKAMLLRVDVKSR